jgi:peptide chain release factor 2
MLRNAFHPLHGSRKFYNGHCFFNCISTRQYATDAEVRMKLSNARQQLATISKRMQIDKCKIELDTNSEQVKDSEFWDDVKRAQLIVKKKSQLEEQVSFIQRIETEINNNLELLEMLNMEDVDETEKNDVLKDVTVKMNRLSKQLSEKDMDSLLSEKEDALNCYIELHSGAGGTESNDWTEMLMNMYASWAKKNGYNISIQSVQPGKVAGVKYASLYIYGSSNAYGWLKSEHGVHRLVRLSPFNSDNKRHTSFAGVTVFPEVDDSINVTINPKDLKIETMRASGAGGQHVNKTESAIRITHEPTGIVVTCQDQREQHQNRAKAMRTLMSKLYIIEQEKQQQKKTELFNSMDETSFGSQIRSYVLHPYHLVKDLRTNSECTDPDGFLSGDGEYLKQFMKAFLEKKFNSDDP